jgi:spermidine synthase
VITATRFLGTWSVFVNGCEQTGPDVHRMWIRAFKRLKKQFPDRPIRRIVSLGLGGGGEISTVMRAFTGVELTVLEYDPAMIALTKELGLYKPYPLPHIVEGDARQTLPSLSPGFDLAVVDIFHGEDPSPLITNAGFLDSLHKVLAPGGLLLVNVFKRKEYLEAPASLFDPIETWQYRWNNLGLFQKRK